VDGGACNVRGIHMGVDTLGLSMLVGGWVPWFINKESPSSKTRDAPNELATQEIATL
jgi:hypothetical protein